MVQKSLFAGTHGAIFSECRTWRYALWRDWDVTSDRSRVAFIGLNPSTADETKNDPTIRRCINFAKDWGFGGLLMLNAYGFRATLPKCMRKCQRVPGGPVLTDDPIGPKNNATIAEMANKAGRVVAAWGTNCPVERELEILRLIDSTVMCLELTQAGCPRHPLYVKADKQPERFHGRSRV